MAITFLEKRKTQRYLIFVFLIVSFITFWVFWRGYFVKEELPLPKVTLPPPPKIEINFELLKHPILEKLEMFEKIQPIEEVEIGRENPFIPY